MVEHVFIHAVLFVFASHEVVLLLFGSYVLEMDRFCTKSMSAVKKPFFILIHAFVPFFLKITVFVYSRINVNACLLYFSLGLN